MGFLLFPVEEEWFSRSMRIPSGIFWRCKIDEVLTIISFFAWFSVWSFLFGFIQKFATFFASVCEARLRLCVNHFDMRFLPVLSILIIFWTSLRDFYCVSDKAICLRISTSAKFCQNPSNRHRFANVENLGYLGDVVLCEFSQIASICEILRGKFPLSCKKFHESIQIYWVWKLWGFRS